MIEAGNVPYFPNLDDWNGDFWRHDYLIFITAQGILFAVNADSADSALDEIADYAERHMPGLVSSYDEMVRDGYTDLEIEEYVVAGNHSVYFTTHNITIKELR